MQRVAITGIGIVSSIGNNKNEVLDSLRQGRSGVELVPERRELGFTSCLAGTIKNFVPPVMPKENQRQMGRGGFLAVQAAREAIEDAGLDSGLIAHERTGTIVANSGNMQDIYQLIYRKVVERKKLTAMALARTMASTISANLSVLFGMRGQCMTLANACASGATAIGQGAQAIRLGIQDRMLVGGAQEGSWEYDILFDALRVFSRREDDPTGASRPFDKSRDGLVPSAGAGFVILENYDQAVARRARIYAELIGYATNSDGAKMTTPSGEGSIRCMQLVLADARVNADEIDYINAHATSTPVGDAAEAEGIYEIFGSKPLVSSTKSMTGHEIGAAGATEIIYSLLMMAEGFVAPSINLYEPDEACHGLHLVANEAVDASLNLIMSNSFGFGGVNTALILKKI